MKVKFVPQNVEFEIKPGQSVMHVAQDNNLYVKSVCKGVPNCAECRVRVVDGDHCVLPPGSEELSLIGTGHFIDRRRLSCQLKCFGDITVDMTEQLQKQAGLIGKKSKRIMAKDDRVEQAVAIRTEMDLESVDDEVAAASSPSIENQPARIPHRPSAREHQPRAQQQQPRQPRQIDGPRAPRGADGPANNGSIDSGGRALDPQRKNDSRGPRPPSQQGQQPRGPRPPQQQGAGPQGGGAPGGEPRPPGEGGGKKRRRRRGGRGGGGGGPRGPGGGSGGAPSGGGSPAS